MLKDNHMYKILYLVLIFFSCNNKYQSQIFEDCDCNTFSLDNGVEVMDLFENYSFMTPDSSWTPYYDHDTNGACVTITNLMEDVVFAVTFCQLMKIQPWPSLEEQMTEIDTSYNVLENGQLLIDSLEGYWHLVLNEDSSISLQITLSHETAKTFFSLGSMYMGEKLSNKQALCSLESIIYSFKRAENSDDLQLNHTTKTKLIRY